MRVGCASAALFEHGASHPRRRGEWREGDEQDDPKAAVDEEWAF